MPGAAAASFFDATTQRICDHVGKDWVVRDYSKCSCFCKVHFLTAFPFLLSSNLYFLHFLTVLPHFSKLFIFIHFPTFFTPFCLHFSTFFPSLVSLLLYCLHFLTVLTSLLSSLPYFVHLLCCLHISTFFTSLTLRDSYCRCKGRCLIRVLTLVCGIFP